MLCLDRKSSASHWKSLGKNRNAKERPSWAWTKTAKESPGSVWLGVAQQWNSSDLPSYGFAPCSMSPCCDRIAVIGISSQWLCGDRFRSALQRTGKVRRGTAKQSKNLVKMRSATVTLCLSRKGSTLQRKRLVKIRTAVARLRETTR